MAKTKTPSAKCSATTRDKHNACEVLSRINLDALLQLTNPTAAAEILADLDWHPTDDWSLQKVPVELTEPVLAFIYGLINSPTSPLKPVFDKYAPSTLAPKATLNEALRLVQLALQASRSAAVPSRKKTSSTQSIDDVLLIKRDERLVTEVKVLFEDQTNTKKQRIKERKVILAQVSRWAETRASLRKREAVAQEKDMRSKARSIAAAVQKFWRVASLIATRRMKHSLRAELSAVRAEKQKVWVHRAEKYAARLTARLQAEQNSSGSSAVSSEGWTSQEDEDQQYEEEMGSDDENVVQPPEGLTEADLLRQEHELSVEELMRLYTAQGDSGPCPPAEPPREAKPTQKLRSRKRRYRAQGMAAESSSDGEAAHVKDEPDKTVKMERDRKELMKGRRKRKRETAPSSSARKRTFVEEVKKQRERIEPSQLLRAKLRSYQQEGFEWLVNLHDCEINGILADEMGLGKTIQTIALLAYLASVRGIWGPHLIVVPTSVVINWEHELRKFAPGLKVLSYFGEKHRQLLVPLESSPSSWSAGIPFFESRTFTGSKKAREKKRQGWSKPFAFHIVITSYTLAVADAPVFRRNSWYYLVLDEAQNLKNSQSARWQTLLQFNAERRLLLTGTPLQNNLMELWSLMYFLMPHVFGTHTEWKELFSEPLTSAIEKSQMQHETELIQHLYKVLRPFLCRRLKRDVEDQMPSKTENVLRCSLTKRQRFLYDEVIAQTQTDASFQQGDYLAVMNSLMQLRKVCNHPNLLEETQVVSEASDRSLRVRCSIPAILALFPNVPLNRVDRLDTLSPEQHPLLQIWTQSVYTTKHTAQRAQELAPTAEDIRAALSGNFKQSGWASVPLPSRLPVTRRGPFSSLDPDARNDSFILARRRLKRKSPSDALLRVALLNDPWVVRERAKEDERFAQSASDLHFCNPLRLTWIKVGTPLVAKDLRDLIIKELANPGDPICDADMMEVTKNRATSLYNAVNKHRYFRNHWRSDHERHPLDLPSILLAFLPDESNKVFPQIRRVMHFFKCERPFKVAALGPDVWLSGPGGEQIRRRFETHEWNLQDALLTRLGDEEFKWRLSGQLLLPSSLNIEYDAGKLLQLTRVLYECRAKGLKCILFTQMSKMLDLLERYLNVHGFTYMRLDGTTKPEKRQSLIDRFNGDSRIFIFMASTRAGGVGINLTGGSVVIFYDTDWNPAMDRQAMDRCHRLGQTRDVIVYRLITEASIEENIWRKQLQKRLLDDVVVDQGHFTAEGSAFDKTDVKELLFTIDSTDDLYMTRRLHDKPSTSDILLAGDTEVLAMNTEDAGSSAVLANALAAVEDAEDVIALSASKKELAKDLDDFRREFSEGAPDLNVQAPASSEVFSEQTSDSMGLEETAQGERKVKIFIDPVAGHLDVSPLIEFGVMFLEESARSKVMEQELAAAVIQQSRFHSSKQPSGIESIRN